jgi:hypothetical protein
VHRNDSHWYNNASFSLPLIGGAVSLGLGFVLDSDEARGFGIFLLVVAALMGPFIVWSWRGTPTAIAVTTDALVSLHGARVLKRLEWSKVVEVERKETLGNVRWRVLERDGDHIAIEGEIEDVPALIAAITRMSGRVEEVVTD